MRRLFIQFTVAMACVLLVCATAMAADSSVRNLEVTGGETVTVVPRASDDTEVAETNGVYPGASLFQITRETSEADGQLYAVLIRLDDESRVPTKENIYYLDVVEAADGTVSARAFPKDLTEGTYLICLSDYTTDGSLIEVATFDYGSGGSDPLPDPSTVKKGFVVSQSNTDITATDALYALYISAGRTINDRPWTETEIEAAKVDADDYVTATDALWILERSAGRRDANWNLVN